MPWTNKTRVCPTCKGMRGWWRRRKMTGFRFLRSEWVECQMCVGIGRVLIEDYEYSFMDSEKEQQPPITNSNNEKTRIDTPG